ncbi:hypothetical protein ACF0H5_005129 [Mactra antiquata]
MTSFRTVYLRGNTEVILENAGYKNKRKFRNLARQVSGEGYDIPDNNEVLFVYEKKFLAGELCFLHADLSLKEPETCFDSPFFPQISFMFVHQDFQQYGYGKLLLKQALDLINEQSPSRPVRLQSAMNAVSFFEKCGFKVVGEPMQCFPDGSHLFRTLVNMELK